MVLLQELFDSWEMFSRSMTVITNVRYNIIIHDSLKKAKSVFINLEKINDIFVVLKLSRDPVDKPWLVLYLVLPGSHVLLISYWRKWEKLFSWNILKVDIDKHIKQWVANIYMVVILSLNKNISISILPFHF